MRFIQFVFPTLLSVTLGLTRPLASLSDLEALQSLNDEALSALQAQHKSSSSGSRTSSTSCSVSNAVVRREWSSFSSTEKKEYIAAIKCLQAKPSIIDPVLAPGAKTRYDDFIAGNFLTWHRYMLHTYEVALRNECGYTGYQPYWNWLANREDPSKSPLFDGSDTSFGGDGAYLAHNGSTAGNGYIFIPSGQGGGCVKTGPFVDYVVNLGPVRPWQDGMLPAPQQLAYNPHCLSRDLRAFPAINWLTLENILNVTIGDAARSIAHFQSELQGRFSDNFLGLHTAGHAVMGGTSGDIFASPADPSFYLHHAMVDRLYWIWQALHPTLADTIAGTITLDNNPPSRNASVDDFNDIGVNAGPRRIRDLFDTLGGTPLCYIYV